MAEFQTSLDVANEALQLLGVPRIGSFTDDSKGASAVAFVYDKVRRAELQRNVWRFSTRTVALRAIDTTVMQLIPATWSPVATYPVGSIVSFGGAVYQALQAVPVNQEPDTTAAYWDIYFGSMNVVPWTLLASQFGPAAWNTSQIYNQGNTVTGSDGNVYQALINGLLGVNPVGNGGAQWLNEGMSSTSTPGYFAGELVYIVNSGSPPTVYLSLENGNTDNPSMIAVWNAAITYNNGDTVVLSQTPVTYNGVAVTYNGTPVFYLGQTYQSTEDLNLGNTPGASTAWEAVPANEVDIMQGQHWLQLNATLQSIRIIYPIGSGPSRQSITRNVYQLPNGYLKKAPQDPRAGSFSFLGSPGQLTPDDWVFQGNYITSGADSNVILLRFAADVTSISSMTSMFCNGLACRIATAVCEELTQSTAKLSMVANEYKTFMGEARMSNAIENGTDEIPLDDYLACRI